VNKNANRGLCPGESDAEIIVGAWDFERINRRYARHLKVQAERPGNALRSAICDLQFEIKRSVEPAGNCARSTAPDP